MCKFEWKNNANTQNDEQLENIVNLYGEIVDHYKDNIAESELAPDGVFLIGNNPCQHIYYSVIGRDGVFEFTIVDMVYHISDAVSMVVKSSGDIEFEAF